MPTLEWIGKDKVINHHQEVPFRILDKKYTFNAENSDNMIIHGDNLLALKSLLPQYEGFIDCIYIDPPYNTGEEKWIYNDNVNDPRIRKWLGEVVGKEGEDLSRHDKWLCMMYPRLKLLQKLLSKDGVAFISIGVDEVDALKLLCNEIFGPSNFLGMVVSSEKVIYSIENGLLSESELEAYIKIKNEYRHYIASRIIFFDIEQAKNPDQLAMKYKIEANKAALLRMIDEQISNLG